MISKWSHSWWNTDYKNYRGSSPSPMGFLARRGWTKVYTSATISEKTHSTAPAKPNCRSSKGLLKQRENTLISVKLQCNMKKAYQHMSAVHIKTIIIRSGPLYQNKQKKKSLLKSKNQNLSSPEQRSQILAQANDCHLKNPTSKSYTEITQQDTASCQLLPRKNKITFQRKVKASMATPRSREVLNTGRAFWICTSVVQGDHLVHLQ